MDPFEPANGELDLTTCDREPIHAPGAIQPHGILLVLSEPDLRIIQTSANLRSHVGLNAAAMLGQSLALLLDSPSHDALVQSLGQKLVEPHFLPPLFTSTGNRFEATVHRTDGGLILEMEPHTGVAGLDVARVIRDTMAEAHRAPTLAAVCQSAAERLRALTGFDRVMVYRFQADDVGSVIGEARNEDLPPYLGLTYPASDIPKPARDLFLRNTLRVRRGNEDTRAPLIPAPSPITGQPLDMTRCALRATSPIHLEYLRNMGVSASLTLSIVLDGRLWGMFACHHGSPKYVPHAHRLACQALGHLLALQIEAKLHLEEAARRLRMHDWLLAALLKACGSPSLAAAFDRLGASLMQFINADGVAILSDGRTATYGTPLDAEELAGLEAWIATTQPAGLFATNSLGRCLPAAAAYADRVSGVLALPLAAASGGRVMWLRTEMIRTVTWAGDPRKPAEPDAHRISPRKSFEAWAETVRGQAEAWAPIEVEMVQTLRSALSNIVGGEVQPVITT